MVVATLPKCVRQPRPAAGMNGTAKKVHPADCPLPLRCISPPMVLSKGTILGENVPAISLARQALGVETKPPISDPKALCQQRHCRAREFPGTFSPRIVPFE